MAWTVSSRCGLIISKRIMSVNSYGSSVGHQQMAKFFESMLLALQFSVTLMRSNKINNNPVSSKQNERKREILDEMLEDEFEYVETDGCQFLRQEIPQWQQTTAPIRCHYKTKRSRATVLVEHVFMHFFNPKTKQKNSLEISSISHICSCVKIDGNRLKKSLRAVATALTAISSSRMS